MSEKPDAAISALDHVNLTAIVAKSIAKVPLKLVVSIRNTVSVSIGHSELWRNKLIPFLAKRLYREADAVIAVSKGVADDFATYTGFPRNAIKVVYNPVVTPELLSLMHEKVDDPWFEADDVPVILGVGRLTKAKDFQTLIQAFAKVHSRRQCRLLILGEGPDRPDLENLVQQSFAVC